MEEKIKIYITKEMQEALDRDMELFEFFKKDGKSLNRNEFLSTLILHYYESYGEKLSLLQSQIADKLESLSLNRYEKETLSVQLLELMEFNPQLKDHVRYTRTVSLKPTRRTSSALEYILERYLFGMSFSAFFRNLFQSYLAQPLNQRERIIFKDRVDIIERAIALKRQIRFTTRRNQTIHTASVYDLCHSKEELMNYVLCEWKDRPFSFRLSRMQNLVLTQDHGEISELNELLLERTKQQSVQFVLQREEEVCVRLDEEGKKLMQVMYIHRPKILRTEGDCCYFHASYSQIENYFIKFGEHALIVSPQYMQDIMRRRVEAMFALYHTNTEPSIL